MSKGELTALPGEEIVSPVRAKVQAKYAKSEYWPIDKLKLWDKNPRDIKPERFKELKERLKRQGQIKPILITEDGTVIGGNMRLRGMADLDWDKVWVSITEAKTDKEIFDLALTDNEEFGYYEQEQLAELALSIGLSPLELKTYEVSLGETTTLDLVVDKFGPEEDEEDEEDEVPEVDETGEPESRVGEVYQLGRHRVMCADSTVKENVALLMDGKKADMVFTDPPYGMNLETNYSSLNFDTTKKWTGKGGNYSKVIGDDKPFNFRQFDYIEAKEQFWWGANYYCHDIPLTGSWLVWDKQTNEGGGQVLDKVGASFELCWSKQKHRQEIIRKLWRGLFGSETQDAKKRVHPTQKPLEVCTWFMERYSKNDDIVLDLFGGSGSTLIACERTDRTCYGMELDPKYVDVIRKRYANHIGEGDNWQDVTPAVKELVNA